MVHVGISVKDFKAIVIHAESLKTSITALYSYPNRPMRIAYEEQGMICEFTLMTIGDYRGSSVTPTPVIARRPYTPRTDQATSARSTSRNTPFTEIEKRSPQETSTCDSHKEKNNVMPPPMQPASRSFTRENPSQRPLRPSPPPSKPSIDPESLFLSAEQEEDRRWGDRSVEEEEDEDTLGWDLNAETVKPSLEILVKVTDQNLGYYPNYLQPDQSNQGNLVKIGTRPCMARSRLQTCSSHATDFGGIVSLESSSLQGAKFGFR